MAKKFYLSKTVVVGALQILGAVLLFVADFVGRGDFTLPAILLGASGVVGIILRFLTSEPITL